MAIISLKGVRNARDLGGIETPYGRIKPHALLRSAHLHAATDADIDELCDTYRLARIIDLRTRIERHERPDVPLFGVEYLPLPIFDRTAAGITHEAATDEQVEESQSIPDMTSLYRMMVSGDCLGRLSGVVHAVVDHDFSSGSVLFHCTEGKDRTGIVALALLSILGVSQQVIEQDYLLTNDVNARRARRFFWSTLLTERSHSQAKSVRAAYVADSAYLDAAYQAIDEQFGSIDGFVEHGLGIDSASREDFRRRVLE